MLTEIKWRYEFNHVKSGIVTFGESKRVHSESMKERTSVLAGESVIEPYKYKNLGVVKNYIGSFSNNANHNIDKTRKKNRYVICLELLSEEGQPFNLHQVLASSMPPHFTV